MDLKKDPDSQYGTGFRSFKYGIKFLSQISQILKFINRKLIFSFQTKINAVRYGINSTVPTVRRYSIKFLTQINLIRNGFIKNKNTVMLN